MRILSFLITLALSAPALMGQDLTATVTPNPVSMGERFQISFTSSAAMTGFRAPDFDGLTLIGGPMQSQSVRIVNGAMAQSISYSYILQARAEGKFTIPSASADIGGKRVQSNPVVVQVVKQSQQQVAQQAEAQATETEITKQLQKGIFLKASVNKNNVMRGEQVIATYKIYTRITLTNYTPRKMPALTGFWNQDIESPQQLLFNDEVINGQVFRVASVKKVALFPQQSGTLELDPMEAEVVARVNVGGNRRGNSRDPFDAFFHNGDPFGDPFGQAQDVRVPLRSPIVKITVRPLPQTNVPAEFNGAVGIFSLETALSPRTTKTNEPVKLTVRVSGKGNLKLIDPVKLQLPPDIETYDPTTRDNIDLNESGASGVKTLEYLLIPRFAGEFKIPPVVFAYYDLDKKRYITLQSEEYTLVVEKGKDENAVVGGKYTGKDAVTALNSDIRFIKLGNGERMPRRGEGFYGSAGFFAALVLPFVLFIGFIFYRRRDEQLRSDIALMKNRTATRIATKRLKEAKAFLKANDSAKFHDAVSKALWGYMSDKLTISQASLSRQSVQSALQERGVNADVCGQFAKTLDSCEFARFAPNQTEGAMQHLYDDAMTIISTLEEQMKRS